MFEFFFRRKRHPEIDAVLGESFVSDLRALVKYRVRDESNAIDHNDVKSWLLLATCQYVVDSIETAALMGRPVTQPQDLVAVSHIAWVTLEQGFVLSRGLISRDDAMSGFENVVLLASVSVLGEEVPDSFVKAAATEGQKDAHTFENNSEFPVNRVIRINFSDYLASKEPRLANFLGQLLKKMDAAG